MPKKYNLNSKSDMRKFQKDLENSILDSARKSVSLGRYDINCPHCKMLFSAKKGMNVCPHCRKTVDLKLDINF